ncbi:MAG: hypothetical protein ACK42A_09785 [Pyrinomonadaceae bacterium]|jgi:hypothetical protein
MATIFNNDKPSRISKGHVIGAVIGIILIGLLVFLAMQRPSMEEQKAAVLSDAYREGSPEFQDLTKDIIISTSEDTVEYQNAFGKISMSIKGKIRNKGTKTINGLEVDVAVIDQQNQVIKDKRVLVVPTQVAELPPGGVIPITLSLDGFDKKDDRANIRWKVTAIRVVR